MRELWVLLLVFILNLDTIIAQQCAVDSVTCLDKVVYEFKICDFTNEEAECTTEGAELLAKGVFDAKAKTFTTKSPKRVYAFTNDCGIFSIEALGLYGKVNLENGGNGFYCEGIYGAVNYGTKEVGQFRGKPYVPPTPKPTLAPCDFAGRAAARGCPDLRTCHRGNWTLSFCDGTCEEDGMRECKESAAVSTWNVTLNWGEGLLWRNNKTYEYKIDCRRWWVPQLKLEAFFSAPTDEKRGAHCDTMLAGTWSGGALSLRKTSELPRPPPPKLGQLGTIVAAGASACFVAILGMLWWARRKWQDSKEGGSGGGDMEIGTTSSTSMSGGSGGLCAMSAEQAEAEHRPDFMGVNPAFRKDVRLQNEVTGSSSGEVTASSGSSPGREGMQREPPSVFTPRAW